ncbi:hypothetical protein [Methanopyrus sp. KOL6]|nr:hypothetical protein [Methanopyrus sp. KOL6]
MGWLVKGAPRVSRGGYVATCTGSRLGRRWVTTELDYAVEEFRKRVG